MALEKTSTVSVEDSESEESSEQETGQSQNSSTATNENERSSGSKSSKNSKKGYSQLPFPQRFLSNSTANGFDICRKSSNHKKHLLQSLRDSPSHNPCQTPSSSPPVIANLPDISPSCSPRGNTCLDHSYNQGYVCGYNESNKRNRDYVKQTNDYCYKFGFNNGWNESNTANRSFVQKSTAWYYEAGYNQGFNDSNDENCKYTKESNDYNYEAGYNTGWNDSNEANECYIQESNDYHYKLGYETGVNDANRADDEYIEKLSHYYYEFGFNDGFDNCCAQQACSGPPCCNSCCCSGINCKNPCRSACNPCSNSCCKPSCCHPCGGCPKSCCDPCGSCCNPGNNCCSPCNGCCDPCNNCCNCCNSCCTSPCGNSCENYKICYNLDTNQVNLIPANAHPDDNEDETPDDDELSEPHQKEDHFNNNKIKKRKGSKTSKTPTPATKKNTICIPFSCAANNSRIRILTTKKDCCCDDDDDEPCCDPGCCPPCVPVGCYYPPCYWPPTGCPPADPPVVQSATQDDKPCNVVSSVHFDGFSNDCAGEDGDTDEPTPAGRGQLANKMPEDPTIERFLPYNMFGCGCAPFGLERSTTINQKIVHVQGDGKPPLAGSKSIEMRARKNHDLKKCRIIEIEARVKELCHVIREADRDMEDAENWLAAAKRKLCKGVQELSCTVEQICEAMTARNRQEGYDEDDDECDRSDGAENADKFELPKTNEKILEAQRNAAKAEAKYRDACKRRRKALREKERLQDELAELRPRKTCVIYAEYIEQHGRCFKVIY